MAVIVTISPYPNGAEFAPQKARLWGTVAIGAENYPVDGVPVAFAGLVAGAAGSVVTARFYSATSGYTYVYDPVNLTIRVFYGGAAVSTPSQELASGVAIPAAVTGDTIYFEATLNRV